MIQNPFKIIDGTAYTLDQYRQLLILDLAVTTASKSLQDAIETDPSKIEMFLSEVKLCEYILICFKDDVREGRHPYVEEVIN